MPGFYFLPSLLPIFIFERNLATFSPLSTFAIESQEALSLSGLILAGFYESAEQPESHPVLTTWQACVEREREGSGSGALASRAHSTRVGESVSKSSDQPAMGASIFFTYTKPNFQ